MKPLGLQRWTLYDAVRLARSVESDLGLLPADTPGTVVRLEFGRRVLVRLDAGETWIDQDALAPAQRSLLED